MFIQNCALLGNGDESSPRRMIMPVEVTLKMECPNDAPRLALPDMLTAC